MSNKKMRSLNPSKLDLDSKTKTIKMPNHLELKKLMIQSKETPEEKSISVENQ